jgi:PKD repeat protein
MRAVAAPGVRVEAASWSYGDGQTGSGPQVSHTWPTSGTYLVTVSATLSNGRTASASVVVPVDQAATQTTPPAGQHTTTTPPPRADPTARLSLAPASGKAPLRISADASGSTAGSAPIIGYAFDFGDGGTAAGAATVTHTYAAAGTFVIGVTVTDSAGHTATARRQVTVTAQGPTARLTVSPTSGAAPLAVTADASGSTAGSSPLARYSFDFGGGTTSGSQTRPSATHTYSAGGTYTVTVTVTDAAGNTATQSRTVTVSSGTRGTPGIAVGPLENCAASPHCLRYRIHSTGTAPLVVSKIDGSLIRSLDHCTGTSMAPGGSCDFSFSWYPTAVRQYITIYHNAPGGKTTIDVTEPR